MSRALEDVLTVENGFELVGMATNGAQVLPLVGRTGPDLLLLDLQMPVRDGFSCLAELSERYPLLTVAILSGSDDAETIERALLGGAAVYIAKSIDPLDLPAVLRQALEGNIHYTTPRVTRDQVAQAQSATVDEQALLKSGLTARELEVLTSVARGRSNRAAGKELFLSDQTVKFHLHRIYSKLGVGNRTEAARLANELGLLRAAA
jgi:DNA-binding NarL/FixJ family response regulator